MVIIFRNLPKNLSYKYNNNIIYLNGFNIEIGLK